MNLALCTQHDFIAVVVALIVAAAVAVHSEGGRTSAPLRVRFGTEYERAAQQQGE